MTSHFTGRTMAWSVTLCANRPVQLASFGTPQQIQAAIDKGAAVNATTRYDRWTPLMVAAACNSNPEVIKTLLEAGADVNAQSLDGKTPLIFAVINNENPVVFTALLAARADAKTKDKDGKTALDYAQDMIRWKGTEALKQLEEASK